MTSFIYELPCRRGRRFEPGGVVGAIAGGWSVNGILTLSDGRPFTVTATDQRRHRPGPHLARQLHRRRGARRLQPDARLVDGRRRVRADDDCGPTATARNNTVRGPGSKSMNLSVFRSIALGADGALELRVETFNLFNWVNYGFPAANISNLGTLRPDHQHARRSSGKCSSR